MGVDGAKAIGQALKELKSLRILFIGIEFFVEK